METGVNRSIGGKASTMDILIGYIFSTDGIKRPIFEQLDGRQYVHDDDGEPVFGVWMVSEDGPDLPVIVSA